MQNRAEIEKKTAQNFLDAEIIIIFYSFIKIRVRGVQRRRNYIGVALKLLPLITKCFKCQTFIGLDRLWVQKIKEHLKNEITSQLE